MNKQNLLSTNYDEIKTELKSLIKSYYHDNFNNFSDNSLGMLYINTISAVGDMLSYYTESSFNESTLGSVTQLENALELAHAHGYKPIINSPSHTICNVSIVLSDNDIGAGSPYEDWKTNADDDTPYVTINGNNLRFESTSGISFKTNSILRFTKQNVLIEELDDEVKLTLSIPVYNLNVKTDTLDLPENPIKYFNFNLEDNNLVGIKRIYLSTTETDDPDPENIFYEVDSLAQNTILKYDDHSNKLKNKWINNKFITKVVSNNTINVTFGTGSIDDTEYDENYNTEDDIYGKPSTFLYSKSYGTTPHATVASGVKLYVEYYVSVGEEGNVAANTIDSIIAIDDYILSNYDDTTIDMPLSKLTVINNKPAYGGGEGETLSEMISNTIKKINSQDRLIVAEDYKTKILNFPSEYGKISKVHIAKDKNDFTINIYPLSNTTNGLYAISNFAKQNLKTYLNKYRMLTDAINIIDPFIINIAVEFEILIDKMANKDTSILNTITIINNYFEDNIDINSPIDLNKIKTEIVNNIPEIIRVSTLNIYNKFITSGEYTYSGVKYDLKQSTVNGTMIVPPKDISIFEIKYKNHDIKGVAINSTRGIV